MWTASMEIIAWKDVSKNESVIKEKISIEWLDDDEEWEKTRDILKSDTLVRLQVRRGEKSMMLVQVLDADYQDDELQEILQESMKPVIYKDEILGEFKFDRTVEIFEKSITWAGEEGDFSIYFYDEDMFWGHCIIVEGNINGEFTSAQIAG